MKSPILLFLLALFLFTLPSQISAQYITKKRGRYIVNDEMYKKDNLGLLFQDSKQSMKYYQEGIHKGRKGKKFLIYGTTMFGSSLILITMIANNSRDFDSTVGTALISSIALGLYLGGLTLDLVSIPFYASCRAKLKSAVNHYNWEVQEELKKQKLQSSINIRATNHGLRLVFSF